MATLFALLLRLRQCCCHLSLLENAVELNEIDGVDPLDDISKQLESLNLKGEATASSEPAAADVAKDLITSSRQKLKSSFRKSHCSSKVGSAIEVCI